MSDIYQCDRCEPPDSGDRAIALQLSGLSGPLEFLDCPELALKLALILRGWDPYRVAGGGPGGADGREPMVSFRPTPSGYEWRSGELPVPDYWRDDPPITVLDALCEIHYELTDWFMRSHPDHLCLHGAAAKFGDDLVLFPSPRRAGKSTMVIMLAMAGYRIFNDDVLPLAPDTNYGVALGVLPRLRLPLASDRTNPGLAAFMREIAGPGGDSWQYAALPDELMAPLGEEAPIGAIVLLDRKHGVRARLSEVGDGEIMKEIIAQNFANGLPVTDIFDRLRDVVQRAVGYRLTYSCGAEAVRLLGKTLFRGRAGSLAGWR